MSIFFKDAIRSIRMSPDLSMLSVEEHAPVARALSKKPQDRWPSCSDFVKALRMCRFPVARPYHEGLQPSSASTSVSTTEIPTRTPKPRLAWWPALLALAAVILLISLVLLLAPSGGQDLGGSQGNDGGFPRPAGPSWEGGSSEISGAAVFPAVGSTANNDSTPDESTCFHGHTDAITAVTYSPNGHQVLSGSKDATLRLWDVKTKKQVHIFKGNVSSIDAIAFSHEGTRVLSVGGQIGASKAFEGPAGVGTLIGRSKQVISWDVENGGELRPLKISAALAAFRADGERILVYRGNIDVDLWDLQAGKRTHSGGAYGAMGVRSISVAAQGDRIALGTRNAVHVLKEGASVRARVRGWAKLSTFRGSFGAANSVALSPDGTLALAGCEDKTVRLWNIATWKERAITGHTGSVLCVAFSCDGSRALSGGTDNTVRLWDLQTTKELRRLRGHTGAVTSVAFSPDGTSALSGSEDATVRLWELPK